MYLITKPEIVYSQYIAEILKLDVKLGLFHNSTHISLVCKNMLGWMMKHFRGISFVEVTENEDENTSAHYQKMKDLLLTQEERDRYCFDPSGIHRININPKDLKKYETVLDSFLEDTSLFESSVFKKYNDSRKDLKKALYQYGVLHVFCHEYAHIVCGHLEAENKGKIHVDSEISKALEYNADLFAVNQMCKRAVYDTVTYNRGIITVEEMIDISSLMSLAVYIYLESAYDRNELSSFYDEINNPSDHIVPFLRQFYIASQFGGIDTILKCSLPEEEKKMINQSIFDHIDAFENSVYKKGAKESPSAIGAKSPEISKVQEKWNEVYHQLAEYISSGVEIRNYDIFNSCTLAYDKTEYKSYCRSKTEIC